MNCDFGKELTPHELVATAFDGNRRELQTIRQWVNLPLVAAGRALPFVLAHFSVIVLDKLKSHKPAWCVR